MKEVESEKQGSRDMYGLSNVYNYESYPSINRRKVR